MRMIRKSGQVIARPVGAELVKHQEGIEHVEIALPDDAIEFHASTIADCLATDNATDRTRLLDR